MPDGRRIKLVITAISDRGNYGVDRGKAYTEVMDIVVDDTTTLLTVLTTCRRELRNIEEVLP